MINQVIAGILADQAAAKRHGIVLAYLAGYITRDERDLLLWRVEIGLPA